jgi:two-component system cell cycle sensor histidine kinase/response regulator CckA
VVLHPDKLVASAIRLWHPVMASLLTTGLVAAGTRISRSNLGGAFLSTPKASGERTILVVDDDPDVREYAISVLEDVGYRVLAAADGEAALALLERYRDVDVLFTDVVMPGLNGFEVAKRAVAVAPRLKVLFASGYATDLTPAGRLLKKPYRPQQLCQEITALLPQDR